MGMDRDYLGGRIKEVRETIVELKRLASKPYREMTLDEKYSMRYQLVVLAEAVGSVGLHVAREDLGREPESYAECLKLLESAGIIESAMGIIKLMRLRNLLIHRYWVIDDAKVYEAARENFGQIEKFLDRLASRYGVR